MNQGLRVQDAFHDLSGEIVSDKSHSHPGAPQMNQGLEVQGGIS